MNVHSEKLTSLTLVVMVLLSVFAGTAAAAPASDYEFDAELEDGRTYWEGQTLYSDEGANNSSEIYELHGDNDANSDEFQQVRADEEGVLLVDTEGLKGGDYYLETATGTRVADFTLFTQSFSVEADDDESADSTYTFEFDSNRVDFDVIVEADGLSADELEDAFQTEDYEVVNADDDEKDEFVLKNVTDGDEFDATFGEDAEGEYDFTFTVRDTGVSDSVEDFSVAAAEDAEAAFSESYYTVTAGDVAEFTIEMENTETAEVVVGDSDVGYEYTFEVVDGNEDGVVTVEFNTFNAGDGADNTVSVADSEDSYSEVSAETEVESRPLEVATYDLSVFLNNDEKDVSALRFEDGSSEGVSTLVVPAGDSTSDVEDIRKNAVEGDAVAMGDSLVVAFEASGLGGQLADVSADQLYKGHEGLFLEIEEANPGPNRDAEMLDASHTDFYADAENNTYYVVIDSAESNYDFEDGDEYNVNLNFTEDNLYVDDEDAADDRDLSTSFSVVDDEVEFDNYDDGDDMLYVSADEEYTVSGTTTLAPGTELTVVARSEGETAFLHDEDVVVTEDGTFAATFDFSDLQVDHEFTIEVRDYDVVDAMALDAAPETFNLSVNTVDENGEAVNATLTLDGDAYEGDALTNGTYSVEATADGYSAASQDVSIDGSDASVTLTLGPATHDLSVVTVDENGEEVDANVSLNGEAYSGEALENGNYTVEATADGYEAASQEVTIDGAAQEVTLTLTAEETATPEVPADSLDDNSSDEDNDSTTTENPGQPGFGLLVALVALVAAALLAQRRD